jgi:hypothetical protein
MYELRKEKIWALAVFINWEFEYACVPAFSSTPLTEEPQEPIARGRANLREVAELY